MGQEFATAHGVPLRMQWTNARGERDLDRAEALTAELLKRRPEDESVRRYMARLLESQGRTDEAEGHWAILRDSDSSDFEAAYQLARAATLGGASFGVAVSQASPAGGGIFRKAIGEALSAQTSPLEGEFRHVAICGVSYCGSTLIDRLLGGLPDVKSTGESHWITKVWADGKYREMDWNDPVGSVRFVPCTVCGPRCEILSHDFRRSLAADNTNWYRKIAARVGTRNLVSADKNLPKLTEKDPLLEMSALVVFKSPAQAWRSRLDKLPPDRDAPFYEAECRAYIDTWASTYRAYLRHFKPQGTVAFLSFDEFVRAPERSLSVMCRTLGLPYDPGVLQRTVPGHAIGGNGRAMKRLRDKDYAVEMVPLPEQDLDRAQGAIIEMNENATSVWQDMMSRHDAMLAVA